MRDIISLMWITFKRLEGSRGTYQLIDIKGKLIDYYGGKYMKLRRILAGLWIVLLLLVGTCYAENTENPIVFNNGDEYWRLNLPSVERTEHLGHYFITASITKHSMHSIPFVGFYATEDEKLRIIIDPSVDKNVYTRRSAMFYTYEELGNVSSAMYNLIKEKFPKLCDEVKADNQIADAKYKADIDKAEAAYNNGDWDTVYAMLKKVYDNGCQSESILENLARASRELGDYDAMIDWDSKRVDSFSSAAAYNARARDYYLLGNNDLALADVNWALMKDKNNAKFLDTRGGIYYEMKQYDKAIKDFDAAIKINDKYAHAYYYRGKCYEALGEKDSAKSDYKKAKKHDAEITDDKADFEKQRSRAQERRQQAHYQKVEKYKEDLKKLNDAVSVHNNAANYPTKVVFENDEIIITVTGNIKNNESKEFYQEVIPQEVRTNYETGVYQQQYEKLKAEVEAAEQAEKAEKIEQQAKQQAQQQAAAQAAGFKLGVPVTVNYDLKNLQWSDVLFYIDAKKTAKGGGNGQIVGRNCEVKHREAKIGEHLYLIKVEMTIPERQIIEYRLRSTDGKIYGITYDYTYEEKNIENVIYDYSPIIDWTARVPYERDISNSISGEKIPEGTVVGKKNHFGVVVVVGDRTHKYRNQQEEHVGAINQQYAVGICSSGSFFAPSLGFEVNRAPDIKINQVYDLTDVYDNSGEFDTEACEAAFEYALKDFFDKEINRPLNIDRTYWYEKQSAKGMVRADSYLWGDKKDFVEGYNIGLAIDIAKAMDPSWDFSKPMYSFD